jgi:hypothetical protein
MKQSVPQLPRRRLNAASLLRRKPRRIIRIAKKLQPKSARQSRHKFLIRIRLRPAQPVIEMNNRKDNPQLIPQLQQHPQKRNRINPARNGDANSATSKEEFLALDIVERALGERMH